MTIEEMMGYEHFIPLFVGSNTPTSKFSESIVQLQWLECSVGDKLLACARLVRANNQWGMKKTPTD
ncbi:hypothetical protein [Bacillus sp. FJAT-51639]|uniref:hypothetical protein n=1 Tax=Bacillus bruguierae TaxID=3127667 RepID=UPI003013C1F4